VVLPSKTINYSVDAHDRRVVKKNGSAVVETYIWNFENKLLGIVNSSNLLHKMFVYGTKSHVPDYMITASADYQIITDHLGSPVMVVNATTGAVVQEIKYDSFGRVISDTNPGFIPFGFAGCLYDQDTQLCRFGARDYDASIGRWTAKDPILFAGGDTNLYGYVENDPVNWLDVEGTTKEKATYQIGLESGGAGKGGGGGIDFIVAPNGTAFPAYGARGPTPVINDSGKMTGVAFTGANGGANGQVYGLRIMNPTPPRGNDPGNVNGYIRYFNSQTKPQAVDPYSGQTLRKSCGHYGM